MNIYQGLLLLKRVNKNIDRKIGMSMELVRPRLGTILGGPPLFEPFDKYIGRPNSAVHENVGVNTETANFK